jgi:hypothetical protein
MITNRNPYISAGGSVKIIVKGNFIRCLSAGGEVVFIDTNPEDMGSGSTFEIEAGLGFTTKMFTSFHVRNTSANGVQLKFVISDEGWVTDNRLVGRLDLNGAVSVLSTLPKYSRYEQVTIAGGVANLFPLNSSRRSITIIPSAEITLDTGYSTDKSFEWNSQQALSITGVNGTIVDIFEDFD